MRRLKHRVAWVGVFSLGVLAGIFLCARLDVFSKAGAVISSKGSVDEAQLSANTFSIENAVINVAENVGPAVVSITVEHAEKTLSGYRRFQFGAPSDNDLFGRFFDDFFGEMPQREFKQPPALGSGVIIDEKGYILTNEHVIADADKIMVVLPDGREFKGEVKGKDARADLAVIKIDANNLPVAKLGDSDNIKIGQWVIAIGNPFGFAMYSSEPTVTVGVVSAINRSLGRGLSRGKDFNDLIQTDAAINPGNSGGPLVNLRGEVVGINVAIFSTSGGYQGIGFAIPSNSAKRILDRLIEGKKILYGWLGVSVQDLDEELAEYFGLLDKTGVLVNEAIKDGPADNAGIKSGDIILTFDGKKIVSLRKLLKVVGDADVGKKVKLNILRDKKEKIITVKIGERPDDAKDISLTKRKKTEESWRGLSVKNIDSELQEQLGLESNEGVIVVDVEPDSFADDAGLLAGDVIEAINKDKITDVDDFQRTIKRVKAVALIRTKRGYLVIKAK